MSQARIARSIHHIHYGQSCKLLTYDKNHDPYKIIQSGEEVSFDNTHAGFNMITRNTTEADLIKMAPKDFDDIQRIVGSIYVTGPVYVEGAEPGDTLKVEVLELQTGEWGWGGIFPGLGLLHEEIPGPHLRIFDLKPDFTVFKPGIHIPCQPFYGTMGVAPAEGSVPAVYPRNDIGGNFDCRYLGQGSTMYLPVNVPGALFAVGDGHFSQGDGEITGAALETTMRSRIRLTVIKGKPPLKSPHYTTDPERYKAMHCIGGKADYGVLATASTREVAIKDAVNGVLDWLVAEKELTRVEGYILFSIAGNLKHMHELGLELYTVSASIPLGLFVNEL